MENKDKLKYDKYGFAVYSSTRKTKNSHLFVNVYYVSNNNFFEDIELTFECVKVNILKDRARQRDIETFCRQRNIAVAVASAINQKYGIFHQMLPTSLDELIEKIPDSLIKNNEAMKELLLTLNDSNKQLLLYVGEKIKEKREKLKQKELASKLEDETSIKKFEEIKEEFGL